jgi:VWFA-related protein
MTIRSCATAAAIYAACVLTLHAMQEFKSRVDVVLVDVFVQHGSSVVAGLTIDDFALYDDGLPQRIVGIRQGQLPIDLTVLLDSSGSTSSVIENLRAGVDRVVSMLRPDDRVRITAFATEAVDVTPLQAPGRVSWPTVLPGGGTSLQDATALALMRKTEPGRRHLVVGFTDGIDTTSVLTTGDLNRTARMSEAVLYLMTPRVSVRTDATTGEQVRLLTEAAQATGGDIMPLDSNALDGLSRVFVGFRESYVLQFSPSPTNRQASWHQLSVRVKAPTGATYTVRHRRGYLAGR